MQHYPSNRIALLSPLNPLLMLIVCVLLKVNHFASELLEAGLKLRG
jgi:hypothetical protein